MIGRPGAPVVDIERAIRRVDDGRSLLAELMPMFLDDLPAQLAALRPEIET